MECDAGFRGNSQPEYGGGGGARRVVQRSRRLRPLCYSWIFNSFARSFRCVVMRGGGVAVRKKKIGGEWVVVCGSEVQEAVNSMR